MRTWICLLLVTALAVPALGVAAKGKGKGKSEAVTEVDEDKAGYYVDSEVDFRHLRGKGTADGLDLSIELWRPWSEIPDPGDTELTVKVHKPRGKAPTDEITVLYDGTWELRKASKAKAGGSKKKKGKGDAGDEEEAEEAPKAPARASGKVTFDGNNIDLTVPWSDLGYDDAWVTVSAKHGDRREGKVYTTASDSIPNKGKFLSVRKSN
jgi:hypothetical protein